MRRITLRALARCVALVPLVVAGPIAAQSGDYPSKPVRLIAGAAAGGTGDVLARVLGEALSPLWKQQAVIENRAGAGGVIAMQALLAAPADAHTLLVAAGSYLTISPFTQVLPYDVERDFTPIAFVAEIPIVISSASRLPYKTLAELVAFAKANPGAVTFAANTPGTFPHMATELFLQKADLKMTFVPYKGSSAAIPDALAGRIDLVVEGLAALAGGIKSGGLRPLGVTSTRRLPSLPDVPSIAESVPGYSAIGFYAIVGQAKMPQAIVKKLNEEFNQVLARADVAAELADLGNYVRTMSVEELDAFLKSERATFGPLVRRMGLAAK